MPEYVGLVVLLPFLAALVAATILRRRMHPLALLGLGHAASVLTTVVRGALQIPAFRSLGLFDPFLAILVAAGLMLVGASAGRASWRRLRAGSRRVPSEHA